jgi:phosphate transport system protein
MREAFTAELDAISDDLVHLTRLVGSAMNRATQSLLDADLRLAEEVIAADEQVDVITSEIEEKCFDVIALQAPVASDLRIVIGALRIASSLERMGDIAEAIVSQTGAVIATKDVALATDIARHDEQMDHLHRELFTIVLSPSWKHGVEAAIDVTLLSRFYERYADHAVSVTRRVVTIVTGEPYAGVTLNAGR